jgi:hypothetical protein
LRERMTASSTEDVLVVPECIEVFLAIKQKLRTLPCVIGGRSGCCSTSD